CILNPAPAQPVDLSALKGLDYFVPNESEAETIIGQPVRNVEDAGKCAEKLVNGGIRRAIITLGGDGSFLASSDGSVHQPSVAVNSVASAVTRVAPIESFAVFLADGVPEQDPVRRANLYAALSTTGIGT